MITGCFDTDIHLCHYLTYKTIVHLFHLNKYFNCITKSFLKFVPGNITKSKTLVYKYGCRNIILSLLNNNNYNVESEYLKVAAEFGHLDIVKLIYDFVDISNSATIDLNGNCIVYQNNVDKIWSNCNNALLRAAENGHVDVVRYLYNLWEKNKKQVVLHIHTIYSLETKRKIICDSYPFIDKTGDYFSLLLSDSKTKHIHLPCFYYLQKKSLIFAATNGHLDVVQYLQTNNINLKSNNALIMAAKNGHLHVVTFLHSIGYNLTIHENIAVRMASKYGHLNVVKFLCLNGANINDCDNYAVRIATVMGHLDLVVYICENHIKISKLQQEIIITAIKNKHLKIQQYFCEKYKHIDYNNLYKSTLNGDRIR